MSAFIPFFLFWICVAFIALCALIWGVIEMMPSRRERFAAAALQGLLSDPEDRTSEKHEGESCYDATARLAVNHADALIKRLDNTTEGMDTP